MTVTFVLEEFDEEKIMRESEEKAIRPCSPPTPTKDYLGNGVYVDIDDFGQIQLTTENGIHVHNEIFLDLNILAALNRYVERMKSIYKENIHSDK